VCRHPLLLGVCLLAGGIALAAPQAPAPKEETAPHESREGEDEEVRGTFQPLSVMPKALQFKDPAISTLAARIMDGSADLRDRRSWHEMSLLYAPFDALPPAGWRAKALADGKALSKNLLASYSWQSLGPTNYQVGAGDLAQGRASCLWVNPNNLNYMLAGFADGGVWKSTNGGGSWTPIADFEITTSVGSIDVLVRTDTVNLTDAIIYVGLGEGNTAGSSVDGGGVLKSVNGGTTWTLQTIPWAGPDDATNARFRHSIRKLVIDPNVANAQSVWIAGDHGVYRTVDGGTNWTLVTALPYTGKPGVGGCWPELPTDFVIDPTVSPSRLYVAFGARSNSSPYTALSCTGVANDPTVRRNNGIYRSTDGGTSWTSITGVGFPTLPGRVGRITLMQAPSDKKQIYALISCVPNGATTCPSGTYSSLGIFRTADATVTAPTWAAGSTTNFCASQGWYDLAGAVDPTNPTKLFVAGLDTYLSTNSGGTLTKKSSWTGAGSGFVHADQHQVVYANATTVFIACDGGIFKGTITGGTTVSWQNLNGGGLSTLQFYGIGQHPTNPARIHGGLQDNGEAYTADGITWFETEGGDGGMSATDWANGEIAYEEYVYAAIARSTSGGASGWTCLQSFGGCSGCGGCVPDGQTAFIAPIVLDANDPAIMYTGSKWLYRNLDARTSATWSIASPDLVGTPYDYIVQVHSAPNAGVRGTIWVTTLNGKVWVTFDDGANWTDATKSPLPNNPVLPNRAATWAATHPADGRKAIVVFAGWNGSLSQPGHVFRTLDGGATWTDISGALPDEPVFTVAVDPARPNDVYIGTEFGVYVNNAGWTGSTWSRINAGQLPNVHVNQLEFSRANGKLRAATHGRGIWELSVACPSFTPPVVDPPAPADCGVSVAWTPSGATGPSYNVYRAKGGCGGTFAPVATGVTGTTFVDNLVSGGQTYGYRVTTAEAAGSCESAPSACQTITVSGGCPCFDAPSFAGLASVTTPFSGTCTLDLSWSAGTAVCGGVPPVYNVYRSTNPSFVPGPSNRIATCVSGNAFSDAGGLAQDSPVYYVVRAEDGSGTGGGPCRGGIEEQNQVRRTGSALGTLVPAPFQDGAELPQMTQGAPLWGVSGTRSHAGGVAYFANGSPTNTCAALTTPLLVPGPAGSPSVLSFWSWRDTLESPYDGGIVEISTNGGTSWAKLPLAPGYPSAFGPDSTSCANTQSAPASAGFTGNDVAWSGPFTADLSAYAGMPSKLRFQFGTDPAVTSVGWYIDDIAVTNTSQATSCSTGAATVAEVSSVASGLPLLVEKSGVDVTLSYQDVAGAGGYNVYDGLVGSWYSHGSGAFCAAASTYASGRRQSTFHPKSGNRYFLVTAYTSAEGPSGFSSTGEIPPASSTCSP